jgi:hypothetical protein
MASSWSPRDGWAIRLALIAVFFGLFVLIEVSAVEEAWYPYRHAPNLHEYFHWLRTHPSGSAIGVISRPVAPIVFQPLAFVLNRDWFVHSSHQIPPLVNAYGWITNGAHTDQSRAFAFAFVNAGLWVLTAAIGWAATAWLRIRRRSR